MITFRPLLAAAAATFALATAALAPAAFAHDGVHVNDAYARTNGGIGKTGAVFFVVENHQTEDDQLIGVASDVAEKVEFHTHKEGDGGVMQMLAVPEGFAIPAEGEHALARGGDHVMLMGLTRDLKDGDTFTLTLTFERAGVVEVEVPVDNARKDDGMGMMHHKHGTTEGEQQGHNGHAMHGAAMPAVDTTGMADPEAITAIMKAQFETPDAPLSVDPITVEGDFALASWAQSEKGGRALLERRDGVWTIVMCGGADLRLPAFLTEHGVSGAERLSEMYNAAEDALGAEKVSLHSSFEGVVMISEPAQSE